ncbi:choline kinase family protein [Kiloniella laminariae]|uniref:Choline kinase family protein n=1 Tax=Kiloniella laminariae TaxID=454162 RepID=A0ABT4LIL9_9PROT|nr:choline kinase family protein [Kiloniella laminariae]MCZ4280922.1 choline kinase family protein [Kiloniella laminariae]
MEKERIATALAGLSEFRDWEPESYSVERLGGLTNLVFRISRKGDSYIVRIPGEGTEGYIDREVESHNAQLAAEIKVSAEVLYSDPASGLMVSRFLDGAETMTPSAFKLRPGSVARAGQALAVLHHSGKEFRFRFELFSMIDEYLKVLGDLGVALPDGYHRVVEQAQKIQKTLASKKNLPLAPCHCDPLSENFLDDGTKMWIVDWEYSGMNDPLWDLGDLSVEAEFTREQDRELLMAYWGGEPPAEIVGRMVIYKGLCDLLWTLWGLIQYGNKNPAEDFWAYSITRFERCKDLMSSASFAGHVQAVEQGRLYN